VPDENSVRGAQAIADLAGQATERDLVLCLISGGGSALLTLPVPGLTLADLQTLTDVLLRSGATIQEMNTVRKHWSRIKGGNLARLVAPATLVTLILSDVVGDPLDVIASGPTVPDPTTVADAQAVLERYGIRETGFFLENPVSSSRSYPPVGVWECGSVGEEIFRGTPKPGDPIFERVQHVIVGSNRLAALAAVEQARQLGFNALLLSTYVEGEAREVARVAAAMAKGMRAHGDPLSPPACLVWGGETTVTIRGEGQGGRNQELALAAALAARRLAGHTRDGAGDRRHRWSHRRGRRGRHRRDGGSRPRAGARPPGGAGGERQLPLLRRPRRFDPHRPDGDERERSVVCVGGRHNTTLNEYVQPFVKVAYWRKVGC
jgi:hydroxypyruvate reductase